MKKLRFHRHCFRFPSTETPVWSAAVDRWYQLDPYAYGLADATYRWRTTVVAPELVVLASEAASNETDAKFAQGGGSSPSKFVHTLPNVRVSSLCLVLEWQGPVLCLQDDPRTVTTALREAASFPGNTWVTGVRHVGDENYEAYLFEFSSDPVTASKFPQSSEDAGLWRELEKVQQESWQYE